MRNKFIVIVIVIVALMLLFNQQKMLNDNVVQDTVSPMNVAESVAKEQTGNTPQIDATKVLDDSQAIKKSKVLEIDEVPLQESINHQYTYDPDPVVDAHLIMEKHRMCYLLTQQSKQGNGFINRLNRRLKDQQRQFFTQYESYCQRLSEKNPAFRFDDVSQIQARKDAAKATSLWGQIIAGEINADSLSHYEIRDLLKQNDPNILSDAPNYLREYYQEVVHWDLEDVLQNRHYDYVSLIRNYAHQMHLCNVGADCSENSITMVRLCFTNPANCGLSYQQYHDQMLTPGQQSDVSMALNYLQSQYQ